MDVIYCWSKVSVLDIVSQWELMAALFALMRMNASCKHERMHVSCAFSITCLS